MRVLLPEPLTPVTSHEPPQRETNGEIFQVVLARGMAEPQPVGLKRFPARFRASLHRTALAARRVRLARPQRLASDGFRVAHQLLQGSRGDNLSAVNTGARARDR